MKDKWSNADIRFVRECVGYLGAHRTIGFKTILDKGFARCESPIEKLFLASLATLIEVNTSIPLGKVVELPNGLSAKNGYLIMPQERIGRYRVDFLIQYYGDSLLWNTEQCWQMPDKPFARVVVEPDGKWHQKDAEEVEKGYERDRWLQAQGFKVFHYTGRAVNTAPMKVAMDCLTLLTGKHASDFVCPDIKRARVQEALSCLKSAGIPPWKNQAVLA